MEFRQLRYFVKIADLGSVSKASRALHIAQPAISQQLAQLEDELGQMLFVRQSSGVVLTEQGRVFYQHAQRILKQLSEVKDAVNQITDSPGGHVAIGLPQSTASQFAFPLLELIERRYPGISLEFFDELSGNMLPWLVSGRLDVGVVVNDDDAALLKAVPLMDERLFLMSRPDRAPGGPHIELEKLVDLPLALPGMQHGVRALLEQSAAACNLKLGRLRVEANSMSIMRKSMLEGAAHSVMPWGAVPEEIAAGTLVATPIEPALTRRVYVCTQKESFPSISAQAVHAALIQTAREQVESGRWQGVRLL